MTAPHHQAVRKYLDSTPCIWVIVSLAECELEVFMLTCDFIISMALGHLGRDVEDPTVLTVDDFGSGC